MSAVEGIGLALAGLGTLLGGVALLKLKGKAPKNGDAIRGKK